MSTQDLTALISLIYEAEDLVERIEKNASANTVFSAHAKITTKHQLQNVYGAEWLARANFRTWEEARSDINAAISILRSLDVEAGGGWHARVGEVWHKVQLKFGWK